MKSRERLDSFIAYCEKHPGERFWQALRNWSNFNFIWGSRKLIENRDLCDTFNLD